MYSIQTAILKHKGTPLEESLKWVDKMCQKANTLPPVRWDYPAEYLLTGEDIAYWDAWDHMKIEDMQVLYDSLKELIEKTSSIFNNMLVPLMANCVEETERRELEMIKKRAGMLEGLT
jgi:hypothetical protein